MPQFINQINSSHEVIGGGIPVYINEPLTRVGSGMLKNKLRKGEKVSVGSPFQYDAKTHESKILKCFQVTATAVVETNTVITLKRTFITPELYGGMVLMVAPSSLSGTGKAFIVGAVDESAKGSYKITVATDSIDAVAVGKFLCESESEVAGTGKRLYCAPDNLTIKTTIGGDQNLLGVPYTVKYLYENNIPAMPDVVKTNIKDVVWEWYPEQEKN